MAEKKTLLDGKKMWFFLAAGAGLITFAIIFTLVSLVAKTETYWVLDPDRKVQAQQVITSDMLVAVNVPASAMPANVINKQLIANSEGGETADDYYALYPINGGDIITTSNVGQLTEFGGQVEEGMVLASFKANPSAASGGIIGPDSRIDIAVIYAQGGAGVFSSKFFLTDIRVVSATIDLDGANISSQDQQDGATATISAAPVLYTVAVTPEQAAAIAVATKYEIYIVLNPGGKVKNDTGASLDTLLNGMLSSSTDGMPTDSNIGTLDDETTVTPSPTTSPTPEATPTP